MNVKFWKRVLVGGCIWYTAALTVISLVMLATIPESMTVYNVAIGSFRTLMLGIFCFALSFASCTYSSYPISEGLRVLIHYVITVGSFMLCVYLPLIAEARATQPDYSLSPWVSILIISIPYFIVYGIYRLLSGKREKKKAKEEYKPVYKKGK